MAAGSITSIGTENFHSRSWRDVETAARPIRGRDAGPAEEDVAMGLHQVLPDDPLVLVGVLALPAVSGPDRRPGLLGLQEQPLDAVGGVHRHDPGAGADTLSARRPCGSPGPA
jgi:hypothetical protein